MNDTTSLTAFRIAAKHHCMRMLTLAITIYQFRIEITLHLKPDVVYVILPIREITTSYVSLRNNL